MNYPTETEHEAMGQRQRTEDHGKVVFATFFQEKQNGWYLQQKNYD